MFMKNIFLLSRDTIDNVLKMKKDDRPLRPAVLLKASIKKKFRIDFGNSGRVPSNLFEVVSSLETVSNSNYVHKTSPQITLITYVMQAFLSSVLAMVQILTKHWNS